MLKMVTAAGLLIASAAFGQQTVTQPMTESLTRLETELAAPPSADEGRHPLPSLQRLQAVARRGGISAGDRVVAYGATA